MWETKAKPGTKYLCTAYEDRPETCVKYPWNHANQIFPECIFYDAETQSLRSNEEQLQLNTEQEISDYCVSCGRCCHFGPAACSMLKVVTIGDPDKKTPKQMSRMEVWFNAVSNTISEEEVQNKDDD